MVNQDDKRFLELMCKQKIHEKRKTAVAKYPERVYSKDRSKKTEEDIEAKYEKEFERLEIGRKLVEKWERTGLLNGEKRKEKLDRF